MSSFFNLCGYRISCSPKVAFRMCLSLDALLTILPWIASAANLYLCLFDAPNHGGWDPRLWPLFLLIFVLYSVVGSNLAHLYFTFAFKKTPLPLEVISDTLSYVHKRRLNYCMNYVSGIFQLAASVWAELAIQNKDAYLDGDFRKGIRNTTTFGIALSCALTGYLLQQLEASLLDSAELLTFRSHKEKQH